MISINLVRDELSRQDDFVSVVELSMILEANVSEVRQRLHELGDRVARNEHDEWRVVCDLVRSSNNSPLSEAEIQERDELENTVQQAFFLAGQSLKLLRDKRLYRETHSTFESYVKERFDFKKSAAYYLISASEVVENLKCPQFVDENEVKQYLSILPTRESQCRPMAKLLPEQQREVWSQALEKSNGKIPSAKIVKEIANQIGGKPVMESKPKRDRIISTPGMETEYLIYSDRETYELLEAYRLNIGAATKNGAIRRLLDEREQRNE